MLELRDLRGGADRVRVDKKSRMSERRHLSFF